MGEVIQILGGPDNGNKLPSDDKLAGLVKDCKRNGESGIWSYNYIYGENDQPGTYNTKKTKNP